MYPCRPTFALSSETARPRNPMLSTRSPINSMLKSCSSFARFCKIEFCDVFPVYFLACIYCLVTAAGHPDIYQTIQTDWQGTIGSLVSAGQSPRGVVTTVRTFRNLVQMEDHCTIMRSNAVGNSNLWKGSGKMQLVSHRRSVHVMPLKRTRIRLFHFPCEHS